jgi:hypothetical protein
LNEFISLVGIGINGDNMLQIVYSPDQISLLQMIGMKQFQKLHLIYSCSISYLEDSQLVPHTTMVSKLYFLGVHSEVAIILRVLT